MDVEDEVNRVPALPAVSRRKPTTGFPIVPLPEAAKIIREAGKYGFEHSVSAFARFMGHSSTNSGASSGGQLLLRYPNAVEVGKPFKLQVLMLVESVNAHNTRDSAAAIMGSLTGNFGSSTERGQMIYLDSGKIGWADDSQSFSTSVKDNTYHTYVLSVDASNVARVSVDGNPALMRNNFVTNGTIAIGDQTNDSNVDSALRIKSVSKLCP